MLLLGGAMLALALAVPAVAGHGKKLPKRTPSAHAVCMQAAAQSAHSFHDQQVAARKAFIAQRKAAKKAFNAQMKANRQSFHQLHPNPTDAELRAFHDQQMAARKAFHDSEAAAWKAFHVQEKTARQTFHTQNEAAKKAC
jgi:hypothetical protein